MATATNDLTKREREVCNLIIEGLSTKEVGRQLGISPQTVKHHLSSAFVKLDVKNRLEMVILLRPNGSSEK